MQLKNYHVSNKLAALWRRRGSLIAGLAAAVVTSLAATGWAGSLYIITGTEDDAAIILDSAQDEAPDLSSQMVYISNGSRGYDIMLSEGQGVAIHHEGGVVTAVARRESVSSLLNRMQIVPSPLEMVGVDLSGGDVTITVSSDLSFYERVTEKATHQTLRVENPELPEGTEQVAQKGADGIRSCIYEVVWSNGEEISRQFVEELNSTAVDEIIEYGAAKPEAEATAEAEAEEAAEAAGAPVEKTSKEAASGEEAGSAGASGTEAAVTSGQSPIVNVSENADGSGTLYLKDGTTLNYSGVRTMKATAYTTGHDGVGTRTASGTAVRVGTVAVDRKVIPLGTRMYITASGGVVYGLAVAEDTGVRGNRIDLYYDTYNECIQFGRRNCTVYILE